MVFLIAGIPALAVLITYYITDSKAKTTLAALIAAAIGVFTGNPIYALLDLALVGGAYWIAMSNLNDDEKARLETAARLRRVEEMERNRAGTDLVDDPVPGWEDRCAAMDAAREVRIQANRAKVAAVLAKLEAEHAAAVADVVAPVVPIKTKRKVRQTGESVQREYAEGTRDEFDAGAESLSEGWYAKCAENGDKKS